MDINGEIKGARQRIGLLTVILNGMDVNLSTLTAENGTVPTDIQTPITPSRGRGEGPTPPVTTNVDTNRTNTTTNGTSPSTAPASTTTSTPVSSRTNGVAPKPGRPPAPRLPRAVPVANGPSEPPSAALANGTRK